MLFFKKISENRIYILSIVLVCLIVGIVYSLNFKSTEYVSSSSVMLVDVKNENSNDGIFELSDRLVLNFEEILKSDLVINQIKNDLKLNIDNHELEKNINIIRSTSSDILKIEVKNQYSEIAIKINEKVLEIFSSKISDIYGNICVYNIDNAHIVKDNTNILKLYPFGISFLIGILLSVVYILFIIKYEKTNDTKKAHSEKTNLEILAELVFEKDIKLDETIKLVPKIEKEDVFRTLARNIQFLNVNRKDKKTILVTSATDLCSKSFVASNLAITFSCNGKKVILIDSDMNNSNIANIFNIPNSLGLSNYLSGLDQNGNDIDKNLNYFINETNFNNLNVMTSGTFPPNSTKLLESLKFEKLIKDLSLYYDLILIDVPPILSTPDGEKIARIGNFAIVIGEVKNTKQKDLLKTESILKNNNDILVNFVLNKIISNNKDKSKTFNFKELIEKIKKYLKIKEKQRLLVEDFGKETIIKKNDTVEKKNIFVGLINNVKNYLFKKNDEIVDENKIINKEEIEVINTDIIPEVKKDEIKLQEKANEKIYKEIENKDSFNTINVAKNSKIIEQKENDIFETDEIKENILKKEELNVSELTDEEKNNRNVIEKINIFKKYLFKNIDKLKESLSKKMKLVNERTKNVFLKIKEKTSKRKDYILQKIEERKNAIKVDYTDKKSNEIIKENTSTNINSDGENCNESDNKTFVIVDVENGYCRIFSKYGFTEKLIKGRDVSDGFLKDNYSSNIIKKRIANINKIYNFSKEKLKRVDTFVYYTLCNYDENIWSENNIISNKGEEYLLAITQNYDKNENESKNEFEERCKRLRKNELEKSNIEIEYILDNIWKLKSISLKNKKKLIRYSKILEPKEKNFFEMKKTEKIIKLYNDVINAAMNKLNLENSNKEINNVQEREKDSVLQEENNEQKIIKEQKKEIRLQRKKNKTKLKEEIKKKREEEKEKQKEEERIEEELLVDNLYPKTKNNRNL